jgi:hypothetical protein
LSFTHCSYFIFKNNFVVIYLFYLFVVYWEEFIKSQLAFSLNSKVWQLESDILLYHILVAVWFAFWENIVYLTNSITTSDFLSTMLWGIGIVIMRWLLGFWAHTFYSSIIWMWNIIWKIMIILWIFIAMLVHYFYNLGLYFDYKLLIPFFIIIVYIWISYIFYKIDRIYISNN